MNKGFAVIPLILVFILGGIGGLFIQDQHNVVHVKTEVTKGK